MLFYCVYRIPQATGIGMPGQKGDDALGNLSISQIVMQLDYPGAQTLKYCPIRFLALPLGTEQRATQCLMLVIHLLALLISQYRVHQLQHTRIGLGQGFPNEPLQTRPGSTAALPKVLLPLVAVALRALPDIHQILLPRSVDQLAVMPSAARRHTLSCLQQVANDITS